MRFDIVGDGKPGRVQAADGLQVDIAAIRSYLPEQIQGNRFQRSGERLLDSAAKSVEPTTLQLSFRPRAWWGGGLTAN